MTSDGLTTLYLRGMSRQLVREAKAEAARRGATLAQLTSEALARTLNEHHGADDLAPAMAWYRAHHRQLARRYRGEYVAIVDGRVVDHGRDFAAVAERTLRAYAGQPVYLPRVGEAPPTVRVRSPRIVG
jgi:hypothetical protein